MNVDFREVFRDRAAWDALVADTEVAPVALNWLTDTIANVSQQLTDAKADLAGGRLPDDEYRELMDWRASALNFRRVAESRKRALVTLVKRQNAERTDRAASTQLKRLRSKLWKLCDQYESATPMAAEVRAALMAEVEA